MTEEQQVVDHLRTKIDDLLAEDMTFQDWANDLVYGRHEIVPDHDLTDKETDLVHEGLHAAKCRMLALVLADLVK